MRNNNTFSIPRAVIFWTLNCLIITSSTNVFSETLIEQVESKYNTIFVYRDNNHLKMTFGYNKRLFTESVTNTKDRTELSVIYTRYMTAGLAYAAKLKNILELRK